MSNIFADFLLNAGLYDSQEITKENIDQLIELVDGKVKIDCYCKECQEKRVYKGIPIRRFWLDEDHDTIDGQFLAEGIKSYQMICDLDHTPIPSGGSRPEENEWEWINWQIEEDARLMTFKFVCSMDDTHHLDFVVIANQKSMRKIGQYPSVADLEFPELKLYKKVLSAEDMKEMKKAIGLNAQGIGVGSYVYLRRIVERLIYKAQEKAINDGTVNQEEMEHLRVVDRIKELKGYLPDMFTNNSTIYGIVSKGIHELSEEECLQYFPILRDSIFMILEKWEEERKRIETEKRLAASLSKISSEIK